MKGLGRFPVRLWRDRGAVSSVEYALLLAFVASGIIFAANSLGFAVFVKFNETAGQFAADTSCIDGTANGGNGGGSGGGDGNGADTGDGNGADTGDGNGGDTGDGFGTC